MYSLIYRRIYQYKRRSKDAVRVIFFLQSSFLHPYRTHKTCLIFFSKKDTLKNDFENPYRLLPLLQAPSFTSSTPPAFSRFSRQFSRTPERQIAHTSAHLLPFCASQGTSRLLCQWSWQFFSALGKLGNSENC